MRYIINTYTYERMNFFKMKKEHVSILDNKCSVFQKTKRMRNTYRVRNQVNFTGEKAGGIIK